ncbi:hypothetical protein ES708_26828 [subsurface metagenome]
MKSGKQPLLTGKKIVQAALTIIILAIGIYYLYLNRAQFQVIKNVEARTVSLIFFFYLLHFYASGYTFKLLLGLIDVKLTIFETFGLSILTSFGNYFGPFRSGAMLKAIYLKTSKGLEFGKFTSVFTANIFIAFFVFGSTGLSLLLLLKSESAHIPMVLYIVSAGLISVSFLPFVFKISGMKPGNKVTRFFLSVIEGMTKIKSQSAQLIFVCITFFVQFVIISLILALTYKAIGFPISFLNALTVSVFLSISNIFSITPNNIGIQEAVIGYLFTLTGHDFQTGVIGASLIRVVHMIITFTCAPVFSHFLMKTKIG